MDRSDIATTHVITGYEVFRFGVPMIGEYEDTGGGRRVTINPAVPGAQYRITAWALDSDTRRSATPAVKSVTTGEASELIYEEEYILYTFNKCSMFTILVCG